MSECVVRMEIPENCIKCPLRNQCEIFCDWFDRLGTSATRKPFPKPFDKGCRMVCQLPEDHGRLIDADAMAKDLNYDVELDAKALDDMSIVGYARERFQFDKNRKQDCIRYLSGQKTIVPAERSEV